MNNLAQIDLAERYSEQRKYEYIRFLHELGDNIHFEDDIWNCSNKKRGLSEGTGNVSIYFKNIPEVYKEAAKYFVLVRLIGGAGIKTVKANISGLASFLVFLLKEYNAMSLTKCDIGVACSFKQHLEHTELTNSSKKTTWSAVNIFFKTMKDWDNMNLRNPFIDNPYSHFDKLDYKYIPEAVATRLDDIFRAAYLIGLIKEQRNEAERLQDHMSADKKGALFTYQKTCYHHGKPYNHNEFFVISGNTVLASFKKICKSNNVYDEYGKTAVCHQRAK
ncbi:MAG: hypothetical protein HPY66_1188 [Firmicutes bacterium]|nr:hypothetical protein [Bacillota bacterium]